MCSQAILKKSPNQNFLSFNSSLLKNNQSKILAVFILIVALILIIVTALSLPHITPIWSPLVPLGVLIISIVIFCILSKPSSKTQKKETEKKALEEKNNYVDKIPLESKTSTRQNSLSSLLNEDIDNKSDISSFVKADKQRTNSFSSIESLLSSTINNSFSSPAKKKSSLILENEDS